MSGPIEGMTVGDSVIEYWRDWGSEEPDFEMDVNLERCAETYALEGPSPARSSAQATSSSTVSDALSPP